MTGISDYEHTFMCHVPGSNLLPNWRAFSINLWSRKATCRQRSTTTPGVPVHALYTA
jgi:hypothetical protein